MAAKAIPNLLAVVVILAVVQATSGTESLAPLSSSESTPSEPQLDDFARKFLMDESTTMTIDHDQQPIVTIDHLQKTTSVAAPKDGSAAHQSPRAPNVSSPRSDPTYEKKESSPRSDPTFEKKESSPRSDPTYEKKSSETDTYPRLAPPLVEDEQLPPNDAFARFRKSMMDGSTPLVGFALYKTPTGKIVTFAEFWEFSYHTFYGPALAAFLTFFWTAVWFFWGKFVRMKMMRRFGGGGSVDGKGWCGGSTSSIGRLLFKMMCLTRED